MTETADEVTEAPAPAPSGGLRTALVAIIAVAALVIAVGVGYAWGHHGTSSGVSAPAQSSVDVGFARDMSTHHTQAVTMAAFVRDYTDNPGLKVLAADIEDQQKFQIGEMQGWLDTWGYPRENSAAPMAWMAGHEHITADGLMPGMATPDQLTKLQSLRGKAMDIMFLQLMINHHLGGIPMARYAAQHAGKQQVRDLANAMVSAQSGEIVTMNQMLSALGGTPLTPPTI